MPLKTVSKKMRSIKSKWLCFLLVMIASQIYAQKDILYTDYKPEYKQWESYYILDKIVYTQTHTIFYFRYVGVAKYNSITLYGKPHPSKWCLEEIGNQQRTYCLEKLTNIALNGEVVLAKIEEESYRSFEGGLGVVYTCEIYFPRLPNDIKSVNLWEGLNKKSYPNHFHCLNILLKTFDSPDLGTEKDFEERVASFNKQFGIPNKKKEKENKASEEEK